VRRTKPHSSTNFSEWGANAAEVRRAGTSDTVEGKHNTSICVYYILLLCVLPF